VQVAVRVVQYPPRWSAAESPDHTLAAQGFSASLEAVLFPVSCSVEHALASRKWQPGMRGGWLPSGGLSQLQWVGFVTVCPFAVRVVIRSPRRSLPGPGFGFFPGEAGCDASGGITKQSPQYLGYSCR